MACTNHPTVDEGIVRCTRCHRQFCQDCVVFLRGFAYCAECKDEQVRDIQSGAPAAGTLDLASVWLRLAARFIDQFALGCAMAPVVVGLLFAVGAFSSGSRLNENMVGGLFYAIVLPISFGVPLVYEAWMLQTRGQTLGKMAVGIQVVTPEGGSLSPGQAWGRTAFHLGIGFCTCIGPAADLLPGLFTEEKTCLHDIVAKTRVVRLPR
jgi:uncharacterized RDD family membrane protein YckC